MEGTTKNVILTYVAQIVLCKLPRQSSASNMSESRIEHVAVRKSWSTFAISQGRIKTFNAKHGFGTLDKGNLLSQNDVVKKQGISIKIIPQFGGGGVKLDANGKLLVFVWEISPIIIVHEVWLCNIMTACFSQRLMNESPPGNFKVFVEESSSLTRGGKGKL